MGIVFGELSAVTREAAGAIVMEITFSKVDELLHLSKSMRKIALASPIGGMALSLLAIYHPLRVLFNNKLLIFGNIKAVRLTGSGELRSTYQFKIPL